jgi:hypothetical protein
MNWRPIDNMHKRDISDINLPPGEAYDIFLSLFQYSDPLITSDDSHSAADSRIRPAKRGLKLGAERNRVLSRTNPTVLSQNFLDPADRPGILPNPSEAVSEGVGEILRNGNSDTSMIR